MADAASDRTDTPPRSPSEAIERAEKALRNLEDLQHAEQQHGRVFQVAVGAIAVVAIVALVVHTFFEDDAPKVDSTSVALLAIALLAPFVPRLKALELGGAKAEWREGTADSLKEIVELARMQQAAIRQLFDELLARTAAGSEPEPPTHVAERLVEGSQASSKSLRRVLWVDDHPEYNTYELESLRRIFDVVTATSNDEAFTILGQREIDALITDVGRDEDSAGDLPGGVRLVHSIREGSGTAQLPILVYTSAASIQRFGPDLDAHGAIVVTSLFSDLLRVLRQVEQRALETTALEIGRRHGQVDTVPDVDGVDLTVVLPNGVTVGVEVCSWLQIPQMNAFTERVARVIDAQHPGRFSRAVLVVRQGVLDDRQREWAARHHVEVATIADLGQVLDRLA